MEFKGQEGRKQDVHKDGVREAERIKQYKFETVGQINPSVIAAQDSPQTNTVVAASNHRVAQVLLPY